MPDFKSLEDAEKYIEEQAMRLIIKELSRDIKRLIGDYIYERWYKRNKPKNYIRTFEFLNSLRVRMLPKTSKRQYAFRIYFKLDKGEIGSDGGIVYDYDTPAKQREMKPHLPEDRKHWSKHAAMDAVEWKGSEPYFDDSKDYNVSSDIPIWIDLGNFSSMYAYKGINYTDYADELLDNTDIHLKNIRSILTRKGFDVEFV